MDIQGPETADGGRCILPGDESEPMKRRPPVWLWPVFCSILTLALFKSYFLIGYVPSASMEPTIRRGSLILGLRVSDGSYIPKKGDVVFFQDNQILLKRIAAVEGDTIYHNGDLRIVPQGHVYVLGDNAGVSIDSRYWEEPFVSETLIIARWIG